VLLDAKRAGRQTQRRKRASLERVAVVGNYLPRKCGIATFTTDLCEALAQVSPDTTCLALPVNDTDAGYAYPPRVRFELAQNDLSAYKTAADFLNINNIDLVCLQHEYGIFGGPAGSHVLALLQELRMPVVTTLHTILEEPDPNQRRVLEELGQLSDRLIVMSERGAQFLRDIYGVPENKIDRIPHGIPDVPFVDPNFHKDQFGLEGKVVLLTFGLLSPNKGIEHVIQALPVVLKEFPNVVYTVVGATHPHVKLCDGESYRLSLQRLARTLSVDRNVVFHNRFVSLEELIEFIGAADIVHHTVPDTHPDRIRHSGIHRRSGKGSHLDALLVCRRTAVGGAWRPCSIRGFGRNCGADHRSPRERGQTACDAQARVPDGPSDGVAHRCKMLHANLRARAGRADSPSTTDVSPRPLFRSAQLNYQLSN
jgi:hypothetical protein